MDSAPLAVVVGLGAAGYALLFVRAVWLVTVDYFGGGDADTN